MARLSYIAILTVCLFGIVCVKADSVEEFKKLESILFDHSAEAYNEYGLVKKVKKMIELIESGDIPDEVQGDHNLAFLKSLDDNCSPSKECSSDEGLSKLQFLYKIDSQTENFESYLNVCRENIRRRCYGPIYEYVKSSLHLDEQTDKIVNALAAELELALRPTRPGRISRIKDIFAYDFHDIVLKTLRRLDPEESKKIAGKLVNKKKSLREYMDKIRSSCVTFVEQINPAVVLWPPYHSGYESSYGYDKLCQLHYTLKTCRKVVNEWEAIVVASQKDADQHLVHQEERLPHYH